MDNIFVRQAKLRGKPVKYEPYKIDERVGYKKAPTKMRACRMCTANTSNYFYCTHCWKVLEHGAGDR